MPMKRCGKCKQSLSVDQFHANKTAKDGKQSWCKACIKESRSGHLESRGAIKRSLDGWPAPESNGHATTETIESLASKMRAISAIVDAFASLPPATSSWLLAKLSAVNATEEKPAIVT